jgi:hypothetical protein
MKVICQVSEDVSILRKVTINEIPIMRSVAITIAILESTHLIARKRNRNMIHPNLRVGCEINLVEGEKFFISAQTSSSNVSASEVLELLEG